MERTLRDLAEARLDDALLEQALGSILRLGEISSGQAEALRRRV
ncbi:hypothetical protein QOL99_08810 [Deinococcus sp. MIMF12]|uniref:Uncharacterized protein n=1 Tax=Deinococcus rhizophilus TaxID=3049544 RepID=A0ABT7JI42_9DEIO|nr:hypothetical protein [Deinococcus rhizophilus]MDL2344252.1 hypothetical protein [Deinococcus rhizophilus]